MIFNEFYQKLERQKYYVFSYEDIALFYPEEKKASVKKTLYRWKKKGWVTSLRKGVYELTYPTDLLIPDLFIANRLYRPSYVSLETALSHYSIIPEVSMAVTSLTPKPTRRFKNKHGLFIYRTIRPEAFTGYDVEKQGSFEILIAEPEKALVDFFYFRGLRNKRWDPEEERLDKRRVARLNWRKIKAYAQTYHLDLKRSDVDF